MTLTRTSPSQCARAPRAQRLKRYGSSSALIVIALFSTLILSAGARAESPWWHLNSGSRPAYLHAAPSKPGAPGEDEVQKLIAPFIPELTELGFEHSGGFVLLVAEGKEKPKPIGEFLTEPANQELLGGEALTAVNLQSHLEAEDVYGAGKVQVQEAIEGEAIVFTVHTKAGVEPLVVANLGLGPNPTAEVANPGKPGTESVSANEIYVTAENVGDVGVNGAKTKVQFTDVLPKGLKATGIAATKPRKEGHFTEREPLSCSLETLTCTLSEGLAPYDQIEMRISVDVQPGAATGELNEVSISGGGAPSASVKQPITVSGDPVPFGVESYEMDLEEEGGAPSAQAGAHPFQLNTTLALNQLDDINPLVEPLSAFKAEVAPAGLTKDLNFKLPPGLIGNPTPIPQCTTAQFFQLNVKGTEPDNACPADSAVGVAVVTVHEPTFAGTTTLTVPMFNLEPRVGEPARFGFYVVQANSPVFLDTSVRTGSDYGVTVNIHNITQIAAFLSNEVTFWGVPGDPRHDRQRGWGCLYEAREVTPHLPCGAGEETHPPPFLSLPTSCARAMSTSVEGDSWTNPGSFFDYTRAFDPAAPLGGCNRLPFSPEIRVAPDAQQASKPTGLTVDVHVPQEVNDNARGFASSNVKTITVALPQEVTLNPSAADGLEACSEDEVGLLPGLGVQEEFLFTPTLPQAFCPDAAKIGTVKIVSPLLPAGQFVEGALYLASPAPNGESDRNPFNSLIALYIIAKDPVSGTLVKLPGSARLDPGTGQVTTTFDNNPQLAFEDAEIHLFGGERAPLAMSDRCGAQITEATFTPWSGTAPVKASSTFRVTSGPNGAPCPDQSLPFAPSLAGGSTNINAGSFSPLTTTINREDGSRQIHAVQLHMPPGLSGILKGVELCSEANANAGTCGPNSLIGHTIVSVGLGADPFSVTGGQVFLTEGYKGAPFGLSIVNPAVAGPFDLGKVIVRAKIEVDPHSAALTVTTDESGPYAIPHILDGIPLQIKHVNVLIDRPGFTFNPTNCNPQAITGTIGSANGASAPVSTAFQVTNCAALKFTPKFSVSTGAHTSKANGASLTARLSEPNEPQGSQANIARVKVELPKQLPSRLTTLQKACTNAQFEVNPAGCPAASNIGHAKVTTPLLPVPLEGPAIFVSHGGEAFPSLTMVLQGYGVTVDLVGTTFINKAGVTSTTFKTVPDVPFNTFELTLPTGPYSALTALGNVCNEKLTMPAEFIAQNSMALHQNTNVAVTGCPKKKALTRAQKLALALKACHKRHNKAKRAACARAAHRRYAPLRGAAKRTRQQTKR